MSVHGHSVVQAPDSIFGSEKNGSHSEVETRPCWYSLSHRRPTWYSLWSPWATAVRTHSRIWLAAGWTHVGRLHPGKFPCVTGGGTPESSGKQSTLHPKCSKSRSAAGL